MSEFIVVLNSEEAVKAFSSKGNMTIGGNLSASAGPIGTGGAVNSALVNPTPMFSAYFSFAEAEAPMLPIC